MVVDFRRTGCCVESSTKAKKITMVPK